MKFKSGDMCIITGGVWIWSELIVDHEGDSEDGSPDGAHRYDERLIVGPVDEI